SQVNPGDVRAAAEEPGLAGLGARLTRAANGWRIEQIYRSDPELPSEASPLAAPGVNIQVGDVITAINGRQALDAAHPSELIRGQAGKQVLLQLRSADGKDKQAIVSPVAQRREQQLRFGDWRYSNARAVDTASGGRIGYLHLRAMGRDDIADFAREFYAQTEREGLIIDVRFNGGGNIDSWILEKLLRRAWAFWQRRSPDGSPAYSNMQQAFRGQLVVLANEETYSDGETFAEGIKRLGLAPVIGKTTSGAGVWLSDQNRLVDNGIMRAADLPDHGRRAVPDRGCRRQAGHRGRQPTARHLPGRRRAVGCSVAHLKQAIAAKPRARPTPRDPRPLKTP
ncbi:S41 family peptidase, partial [Roseateles sp. GG27B]